MFLEQKKWENHVKEYGCSGEVTGGTLTCRHGGGNWNGEFRQAILRRSERGALFSGDCSSFGDRLCDVCAAIIPSLTVFCQHTLGKTFSGSNDFIDSCCLSWHGAWLREWSFHEHHLSGYKFCTLHTGLDFSLCLLVVRLP